MTAWVTSAAVSGWLRAQPAAGGTAQAATATDIDHAVAAVNAWLTSWAGPAPEPEAPDQDADRRLGAVMLAARLVRRRNSPEGVVAITEAGPYYVARLDPDVALLLGLDRPGVG